MDHAAIGCLITGVVLAVAAGFHRDPWMFLIAWALAFGGLYIGGA